MMEFAVTYPCAEKTKTKKDKRQEIDSKRIALTAKQNVPIILTIGDGYPEV